MALDLILTQPQKPFKTADLSISEIFSYHKNSINRILLKSTNMTLKNYIIALRPIRTMKVLFFIRILMVFSERPVRSQASLTDIRILSLSAACIFYVSYILQPISEGR